MGQHKTNPIAILHKKRQDRLKEKDEDEYKDIDNKPWKNMSIVVIRKKEVNGPTQE